MAKKIIIGTFEEPDKTFAGMCSCGYSTRYWPSEKIAAERITQHKVEHETGELMEPLSEFRARNELTADGNRAVFPKGTKVIEDVKTTGKGKK
jgi:hypothetical protein